MRKDLFSLMIIIPLTTLVQRADATVCAEKQFFGERTLKRAMCSFLDPNSLGMLTSSNKDFNTIVGQMDYFKENKKFLNNIREIKIMLSVMESLLQSKKENKEMIKMGVKKLNKLLWSLYPHVHLKTGDLVCDTGIPFYNPEFCGNPARDQAIAKTIKAKHLELQQLFIRYMCLDQKFLDREIANLLSREPIFTSFLANIDTLINIAPSELKDDLEFDRGFDWMRNPNVSPSEYKKSLVSEFLVDNYQDHEDDSCIVCLTLSNPLLPDELIKDSFGKCLEVTGRLTRSQIIAAQGIALNPIAIKNFGERLLDWIIKNEEKVLVAESALDQYGNHILPLTSLLYNYNLSKAISEKLADHLISRLEYWVVFPADGISTGLPRDSKIKAFSNWVVKFAKTAHGSEAIIKKLDSILVKPHFNAQFKIDLIGSLAKGYDWQYYFKNYSMNDDVKLPAPYPEKVRLTIMEFLSRERNFPEDLREMRIQIIIDLLSRGEMNSKEIDKTLDLISEIPLSETHLFLVFLLLQNAKLSADNYQRIIDISASYPEKNKNNILRYIEGEVEKRREINALLEMKLKKLRGK